MGDDVGLILALLVARFEKRLERIGILHGLARPASSPKAGSWEAVTQRLAELDQFRVRQLKGATQEHANAEEWERNATLAVRAGDDELARSALANRRWHLHKAAELEARAKQIEDVLRELQVGIDEIKRRTPGDG